MSAEAMIAVLEKWRSVAVSEVAHFDVSVAGHAVAWWFDTANASTLDFMKALAGDPALVVPSRPADSPLLTRFLRPSRAMGRRLRDDRDAVERWIAAGAPLHDDAKLMKAAPLSGWTPEEIKRLEPEYYHRLVNIEDNSDFLPTAEELATYYFKVGEANEQAEPEDSLYKFFSYSEPNFDDRMKAIYDEFVDGMYSPHWFDSGLITVRDESGTPRRYLIGAVSDRVPKERIFQLAPFNLVDGAWLQRIMSAGPSDQVQSNLFSIWNDEGGNGEVTQNHSNVYSTLLQSLNHYLPPVTSREFIKEDFLPGAFTGGVFQLAVGQFPQRFFPELLGMTLYLEWEATPTLTPAARMLEGRGINPLFYRLHIAIDNISEGHGALAKEAVKLYLAEKLEEGGDAAVQEHWRRIWNGYVTWATLSDFGEELAERYLVLEKKQVNRSTVNGQKNCWPDFQAYYRREMIRLIERKAPFAQQVHGGVMINGQSLNALFDDPGALLDVLAVSDFVDRTRPRDSRFMALLEFGGPMYKVFTEREKDIVLDWIESMQSSNYECVEPVSGGGSAGDLPAQIANLFASKAPTAQTFHDGIVLTLPEEKSEPLIDLFKDPPRLMAALVSAGWIVPGEDDRSMFVTRLLQNRGPMAGVFTTDELALIRAWIAAGAELPDVEAKLAELKQIEAEFETSPVVPWADRRQLVGMGAVH
jgi:Iron-containing redox enzyme